MPLVRVEVRNEYGLGAPELYSEANKEDPKAVLEGVAVAGLVGILRQLGDLAEFAAEVFHGLQEQVMITSSRTHKLMGRVQRIEAALPRLEKLVLAQRNHLHFAYTSGANWHSRLRCKQSHFIYSDLPRFIMDSYEHCRGPPALDLLDKFDPGGPGSCLKRYSDPSFFKRASSGSDGAYINKILKEKKGRKIKKKRSLLKTGEVSHGVSFSNSGSRMQFASQNIDGQTSPSNYGAPKSDRGDRSIALGSRYWSGDLEGLSCPRYSMHDEEQANNGSSLSPARMHHNDPNTFVFEDGKAAVIDDTRSSLSEQTGPSSISVTWDGKTQILEPVGGVYDRDETLGTFSMNFDLGYEEMGAIDFETPRKYDHDENLETLSTIFRGETKERGANHFENAKECDYDDTSETHPTNFKIETEERRTSHFRAANGYDRNENLDVLSGNFDGETEERGVIHFKTAKDHDYADTLETHSMNFATETEDRVSNHLRAAKGCDHDANLEALSTNLDTAERGPIHFKDAKEYDCADTSETHPVDFDLETGDGGTSHLRVAKGYGHDETLETLSMTFNVETEDRDDIHLKIAGQMNIHQDNEEFSMPASVDIQLDGSKSEAFGQMNAQIGNEDVPIPTSSDLQRDDVESETDNYVDALNTIESECETDADAPPKQEVEHYSNSDNKADVGLDMLTRGHSWSHSSNAKSLNSTSSSLSNGTLGFDSYPLLPETCSGDRVTSEGISNSVPLESCALVHSPPVAAEPLKSGNPPDVDSCEIGDVVGSSNVNSATSNMSSDSTQKSLGVRVSDKITNGVTSIETSELQKPSIETSSVTAVKFWTNGGLLGLQPSKPPDFSVLNVSSETEKNKDDKIGSTTLKPDITERTSRSVDEAAVPDCSTHCQDERRSGIFIKKASWFFPSADLGVNLQKLSDSCNQSCIDNSQHNGNSETYGIVLPVSPDTAYTKGSQEKSSTSSRMFELGNKLLMNGFHRNPSLEKDNNSNSTSSQSAVVFELKNGSQNVENRTFSGRSKDLLRCVSPFVSPSSSPPLGHMKISFQPINGFEDHKMQLKFPDGSVSHESSRDMFPSFQLVPEPSVPLYDGGSDLEDDTFSRSSANGSDCLSHQSDSNSEQWESSGSPTSKDHELYDALRRISFTESISLSGDTGAAVPGEVNNNFRPQIPLARSSVEHSQSGHLFDLPSLDTLHPSFMERNDSDLNSLTESQCYKEPDPSPPPLPPPQWCGVKPQAELADNRPVVISEKNSYAFDHKFGSTISQQPKPAPLKQEQISQQPELQKTRQKDVNHAVFQKEIEEKDDFLHQIRTKSFSLRRTVTAKPTATTVLPTSIQVTAILKKANEIRQAVGSDGEDDNWSET
ncbi:hypothetical protein ACH5RR_018130 [Cinchona calisaya]|uniref:Protein SCAR n=1 Tax=Cinchona calisaya TaxID=153742 RepID=A0ABD2ZKJ9_9GENT